MATNDYRKNSTKNMMNDDRLNVVKIQRFSTHDGIGIRSVIFLKGCPLSCKWCHNPETSSIKSQIFFHENACIYCRQCENVCMNNAHLFINDKHIFNVKNCKNCLKCAAVCPSNAIEQVGKMMSIDEIINEVLKDKAFYGKDGGITLSGGEAMLQPIKCINLLKNAKENGLNTAIETCGYFDSNFIEKLCEVTDYFLYDLKDGNSIRHKEYTGVNNELIISNLLKIDRFAKHITIRCIMVKNVNMDEDSLSKIVDIYHKLKHCDQIELIAYHTYGGSKNKQLGYQDNGNINWIPTQKEIDEVKKYLTSNGCKVI